MPSSPKVNDLRVQCHRADDRWKVRISAFVDDHYREHTYDITHGALKEGVFQALSRFSNRFCEGVKL